MFYHLKKDMPALLIIEIAPPSVLPPFPRRYHHLTQKIQPTAPCLEADTGNPTASHQINQRIRYQVHGTFLPQHGPSALEEPPGRRRKRVRLPMRGWRLQIILLAGLRRLGGRWLGRSPGLGFAELMAGTKVERRSGESRMWKLEIWVGAFDWVL